ncbi:MAG: dienelactone hydrolase family protein [Rhizobiales bacterium]|nr:dienelactone hydrolase family protein [Hyphomicrobiales bacterium]
MSGLASIKRAAALALAALAVLAAGPSWAGAESLGLPFTVTKPAGDGPFPAVVILHDCSGLGPTSSGAPWRWSSELTRQGYVTIWPDSFLTRGFPNGTCQEPDQAAAFPEVRVADAYAALAHLRSLAFVDGARIAVMGGSHGGSTTLATIISTPANMARAEPGFAAAIALYPSCGRRYGAWGVERAREPGSPITGYRGVFTPRAPLLILTGALDDWTPAEPCRQLAERAKAAGLAVDIEIYPGAHHSFDSVSPVRHVEGRVNFNAPGGRGATTGGNREAWAAARKSVAEFLGRNLGRQNR